MALSRALERDLDPVAAVTAHPAHPLWAVGLLGLGYAGYVKGLPALAALRIDLTALFALLVAVGVVVAVARGGVVTGVVPGIAGLWLVFGIGAASAWWQPDGMYKTVLLYTVTLLCVLAPAALLTDERSRRWLIGATVLAGLAMAALLLINPSREAEAVFGRLTLEGANSIGTARVVGAGAVAAVIMAVAGRRHRLLWMAAAVGSSVTLVLVGSRGPFVALVLALIVALTVGRADGGPRRVRMTVLGLAVVVGLLVFVTNSDNRAADRIARLLDGSTTDSIRMALLRDAGREIVGHPFGLGWGGFPTVATDGILQGRYSYPHNLIAEAFVEGGWPAGIAVLVAIGCAFVGLRSISHTTAGATVFAVGLYWLLVAQTSGDINANRMTWVMIGLGLVLRAQRTVARAPDRCAEPPPRWRSGAARRR